MWACPPHTHAPHDLVYLFWLTSIVEVMSWSSHVAQRKRDHQMWRPTPRVAHCGTQQPENEDQKCSHCLWVMGKKVKSVAITDFCRCSVWSIHMPVFHLQRWSDFFILFFYFFEWLQVQIIFLGFLVKKAVGSKNTFASSSSFWISRDQLFVIFYCYYSFNLIFLCGKMTH